MNPCSQCLDHTNVPVVKYNFVELKDLETVTKDSICGKSKVFYKTTVVVSQFGI
jgi:hypothetical protein